MGMNIGGSDRVSGPINENSRNLGGCFQATNGRWMYDCNEAGLIRSFDTTITKKVRILKSMI